MKPRTLIAICEYESDGFEARDMMYDTGDGSYVLVEVSNNPDQPPVKRPHTLNDVFAWLLENSHSIVLIAQMPMAKAA